jgi:hypothetical protein
MRSVLLLALAVSCKSTPPPWLGPPSPAPPPFRGGGGPTSDPAPAARPEVEPACASDEDCGYDPPRARCLADPRANRQPPIVDQGVVCYCDGARCASLRVAPVPCESDASCAVGVDPRPHPIAADRASPHDRGPLPRAPVGPCRDFVFSTTCERTNLCTLHRLPCPHP